MRRYEVVFVLAPTLGEEEVEQLLETLSTAAQEKGANVLEAEQLGKRRLAYPIEKFTDGIYVILHLEEEAGVAVAELERRFRVNDAVIRFLSIRTDEAIERAQKFARRREARKERRALARQKKAAAAEAAEAETKTAAAAEE